jgi:MFS family permease
MGIGSFLARLQGFDARDAAASTPLPVLKLMMASAVIAANDISLVSVYPTLPFQVKFFLPELSDEALGRRVGMLGAAFNVGQLFGSLLWGRLSDRIGRRPVMLLGLMGTVFSISVFAFSVNFEMAIAARFAWGLLNGNIGVCKTYLSEVTDDSNQARAFAWLGVSGGLVRLVGPAVGGFLAEPAKKWPATFSPTGFFAQFPFVLSCSLGFLLALVALVLTFKFLEETLDAADKPSAADDAGAATPALDGDDGDGATPGEYRPSRSQRALQKMSAFRLVRARSNVRPVKAGWGVMKRAGPIIACALYTLIGLGTEIMVEIWPLLLLLPVARGGYEMDSSGIGVMLLVSALPQMLVQTILFPRVTKRFGGLKVFRGSVLAVGLVAFLLPFLSPLTSVSLDFGRAMATIGWVLLSSTWMMSFVSSFMITNNSCTAAERGTVNGVGHATVALARIAGPLGGGFLFAWSVSESDRSWPIDFHFTFHLAGLIYLVAVLVSLKLNKSIDTAFKTPAQQRDESAAQIPLVAVAGDGERGQGEDEDEEDEDRAVLGK